MKDEPQMTPIPQMNHRSDLLSAPSATSAVSNSVDGFSLI
jgi:hypothetical protein